MFAQAGRFMNYKRVKKNNSLGWLKVVDFFSMCALEVFKISTGSFVIGYVLEKVRVLLYVYDTGYLSFKRKSFVRVVELFVP